MWKQGCSEVINVINKHRNSELKTNCILDISYNYSTYMNSNSLRNYLNIN